MSDTSATESASGTQQSLAKELVAISKGRWSQLSPMTNNPGWGRGEGTPILELLVRTQAPDLYAEAPVEALDQVLESAMRFVRSQLVPGFKVTYRRGATVLFHLSNFDTTFAASGHRYDNALRQLADEAGVPRDPRSKQLQAGARNRLTKAVRVEMARALLALGSTVDAPKYVRDFTTAWIARPDIEQDAARLLGAESPSTVILWGESGNGKTTAARHLASVYSNQGVMIEIRGPAGENAPFFESDIVAALLSLHIDCRSWNSAACHLRLIEEIQRPGSCAVVVFDNVDAATIERFCSNAAVPTIATTRNEPRPGVGSAIRINEFSLAQSLEFCRVRLPTGDEAELERVCEALGQRPLALDLATRLVMDGLQTVDDLLNSFAVAPAESLEAAVDLLGEDISRNMVRVYELILDSLSLTSLSMLRTIVWWTGSNSIDLLDIAVEAAESTVTTSIQRAAALKSLEQRGLIESKDETFSINTLTEDVLRAITRDSGVHKLHEHLFQRLVQPSLDRVDLVLADKLTTQELAYIDIQDDQNAREIRERTYLMGTAGCALGLAFLGPYRNFGAIVLNESLWFVWQQDLAVFHPETTGRHYALYVNRPSGISIWGPNVTVVAGYVPSVVYFLAATYYSQGMKLLVRSVYGEFEGVSWRPSVDTLSMFPPTSRVRHRSLGSFMPESFASQHGYGAWARCGEVFSPQFQQTHADLPPCDICDEAVVRQPILQTLEWLCNAVLPLIGDKADPYTAASVYGAICPFLADAKDATAAALVHATRAEANDGSVAAVHLAVWVLAALYGLLVARGDLEGAGQVETEVRRRFEFPEAFSGTGRAFVLAQMAEQWHAVDIQREIEILQGAILELPLDDAGPMRSSLEKLILLIRKSQI